MGARIVRQQGDLVEIAVPQESMRQAGAPVDWRSGLLREGDSIRLTPSGDAPLARSGGFTRAPLRSPGTEFVARRKQTQVEPAPPTHQLPSEEATPTAPKPINFQQPLPPSSAPAQRERSRTPTPSLRPSAGLRPPVTAPTQGPAQVHTQTPPRSGSAPTSTQRARRAEPRPVTPIDWRNPSLPLTPPRGPRSAADQLRPQGSATPKRPTQERFSSVPGRPLSRSFGDRIDWAIAGFQPAPFRGSVTDVIAPRKTRTKAPKAPQNLPTAPSSTLSQPGGRPADVPRHARSTHNKLQAGPGLGRSPSEASTLVNPKRLRPSIPAVPLLRDRAQLAAPAALHTPPQAPTLAGTAPLGLLGSFSQRIDWSRAGDLHAPFLARTVDLSQTVAPRRKPQAKTEPKAKAKTEPKAKAKAKAKASQPTHGTQVQRQGRPGPPYQGNTKPKASATSAVAAPSNLRQSARPFLDWRRPQTASSGQSFGFSPAQDRAQSGPAISLLRQAQQDTIAPRRDLRDSFEEAMDWRAPPQEIHAAVEQPPLVGGTTKLGGRSATTAAAQAPILARQAAYMGQDLAPGAIRQTPSTRRSRGRAGAAPRGSLAARSERVNFRSPPETSTAHPNPVQGQGVGAPKRAPMTSDSQQVLPSKTRSKQPEPQIHAVTQNREKRLPSGRLAPQQRRNADTGRASKPQAAPLAQFTRFQGSPTFISRPSAPPPAASQGQSAKEPTPTTTQGPVPTGQRRGGRKSDTRRPLGSPGKGYHDGQPEADEETWASEGFPDIEWTAEDGIRPPSTSAQQPSSASSRPPLNLLHEMAEEQMMDVLQKLTTSSPQGRELLEEIMEEVERLQALDIMRKF